MGAWGYNSFENDAAGDWVGDLVDGGDGAAIEEALAAVIEAGDEYLEAPECSAAIAAAEVVAALHGHAAADLPDEVTTWLTGRERPDATLLERARIAVDAVRNGSELQELWEEQGDALQVWLGAIDDLRRRLA